MTAVTEHRTWQLTIPAPARMYTENTTVHWRRTAAAVKEWRSATFLYAQQANLPKHLGRVRIDVCLHFTTAHDRDALNMHKYVVKPIVDGLSRSRQVRAKTGVRVEPGYELIADDSPRFLAGPHITIGPKVAAKDHPLGLAVVTITDLSGGDTGAKSPRLDPLWDMPQVQGDDGMGVRNPVRPSRSRNG